MRVLRGFGSLWFRDLGSASFLGMQLLFGLIFVLAVLLLERREDVGMMLSFSLSGMSMAIAWQWNRVHASEWGLLSPGFVALVRRQSQILMLGSVLLSLMLALLTGISVGFVGLPLLAGMAFLWACSLKPGNFYLSLVLFFSLLLIKPLLAAAPALGWLSVLLALPAMWAMERRLWDTSWRSGAQYLYQNGMNTGGLALPSWRLFNSSAGLVRLLFPLSYFSGPALLVLMLLLPLVAALVTSVLLLMPVESTNSKLYGWLHLWVQLCVMGCAMVHWIRVMRWRSLDALLLLPLFAGFNDFKRQFFHAQLRLLGLISLIICLLMLLQTLLLGYPWGLLPITVLATFWGCALSLGLGVLCRNSLHITLLMLVMIPPLVITDVAARQAREGTLEPTLWLLGNGLMALLALAVLYLTRNRLRGPE
ncbi:hypothetical protein [Shewanella sedimentimangrovi]|uniref:ABC transporter permease n=1 Tax=Shewanella sedimentimangrovi TaxID=2814293 RepID=A0ABX7R0M2_9GAMM|nr:hypothetical protein [Shewanella sedimentimangrovi]QSX37224.1 hypothetical protein JYB85_18610 [Shewanella sedimentimangrovi]